MGDPRKAKNKYLGPRHPWNKVRIEEEKVLLREFGLKNKLEVYRHNSQIKRIVKHYKQLSFSTTEQAQKEREQLLARAKRLGFLSTDKDVASILNLSIRDALERRLQTIIVKRKLARTPKQARQFIVHRHIMVDGRVVSAPSYIVSIEEESKITFVPRSNFAQDTHPERSIEAKQIKKEVEKTRVRKKIETPVEVVVHE